jgi:hypothetical protein
MALLNSRISTRAADAIAKLLVKDTNDRFIESAFQLLLGRAPTDAEATLCREFLAQNPRPALIQALFSHTDFTTIR